MPPSSGTSKTQSGVCRSVNTVLLQGKVQLGRRRREWRCIAHTAVLLQFASSDSAVCSGCFVTGSGEEEQEGAMRFTAAASVSSSHQPKLSRAVWIKGTSVPRIILQYI